MSKLYSQYLKLKSLDNSILYLFKSGIFYIFLDKDATEIASYLNLKLTKFNDTIYKCGFPISSIDKYIQLLKDNHLKFKIIDSNSISYDIDEFKINTELNILLNKIKSVDVESLSVKEAYEFISNIKTMSNSIKI